MCLLGCAKNCLTVTFCILSFIKISNTLVSDGVSGTEINSCKFTLSNDEVIDLSPLVNSSQPMTVSTNTSLFIYHPCGDVPLNTNHSSDCQKRYGLCYFVPNNPTDKPIDFKKVLSNDAQGSFTLLALNDEAVFRENRLEYPEIVYKHNNSTTVISSYIKLKCNEKIDYYKITIEKSSALEHVLILNSKYVCLHTAHYMSGGAVFFIILAVFLILYFVGGVLVLKFIRGATGIEMIPNHEFWCNLPQLTKDGFKYLTSFGKSTPDSYEKI